MVEQSQRIYQTLVNLENPNLSTSILIGWIKENSNVLDIGSGSGELGSYLHSNLNCRVTGIEMVAQQAALCSSYDRVVVGNIEQDNILEQVRAEYDYIILGDVLEHLVDPQNLLLELKNFLETPGYVLVSVPNVAYITNRLKLLCGRWNYKNGGVLDEGHLRFFTVKTIKELFLVTGYQVEDSTANLSGSVWNVAAVQRFLTAIPGGYRYFRKNLLEPLSTILGYQLLFKISKKESDMFGK